RPPSWIVGSLPRAIDARVPLAEHAGLYLVPQLRVRRRRTRSEKRSAIGAVVLTTKSRTPSTPPIAFPCGQATESPRTADCGRSPRVHATRPGRRESSLLPTTAAAELHASGL